MGSYPDVQWPKSSIHIAPQCQKAFKRIPGKCSILQQPTNTSHDIAVGKIAFTLTKQALRIASFYGMRLLDRACTFKTFRQKRLAANNALRLTVHGSTNHILK